MTLSLSLGSALDLNLPYLWPLQPHLPRGLLDLRRGRCHAPAAPSRAASGYRAGVW